MNFEEVANKLESHTGRFICHQINNEGKIKIVNFEHIASPGIEGQDLESLIETYAHIPDLVSFYSKWGSLRLYHDPISGDSAFYIASPGEWAGLDSCFRDWIDILDEEEEEMLPGWINDCLTIGEVPESGNYLLMPSKGEKPGCIFKFEHDGFEFEEISGNLGQFLDSILTPDTKCLTDMASHLRFVEENYDIQWWIQEYQDKEGKSVSTET